MKGLWQPLLKHQDPCLRRLPAAINGSQLEFELVVKRCGAAELTLKTTSSKMRSAILLALLSVLVVSVEGFAFHGTPADSRPRAVPGKLCSVIPQRHAFTTSDARTRQLR